MYFKQGHEKNQETWDHVFLSSMTYSSGVNAFTAFLCFVALVVSKTGERLFAFMAVCFKTDSTSTIACSMAGNS